MKFFSKINVVLQVVTAMTFTSAAFGQPNAIGFFKQETAEVTDFTGGPSVYKFPFKVRYLVFPDGEAPPEFKNRIAQWLFPPEIECQGSLVLPGEDVANGTWNMLCKSGWMATGELKTSTVGSQYIAEGSGPKGSKVTFKLTLLKAIPK